MDDVQSLSAHPAPVVAVEIQVDPTVNYAVQQNDVTVVKRLKVLNAGPADLEQVTVSIATEPAFAHGWACTIERIPAGETCDLGAVDLALAHDFLAQQAEAVRGSLCVSVAQGADTLAEHRIPMDVLAYDQWNGTRAIPEILAAFVMPNHPHVESILQQAGEILRQWTGDPSFQGYQSKDSQRVRLQAAAIYAAIQRRQVVYCGVAASFERDGQKIRTPDRILESRLGNCLDLATLFAACLEQAGLHPLICLVEGHAFPGLWLEDESFADSVVDDALMLRKRIDLSEICVLESTLAVEGSAAGFEEAVRAGRRHLDDPARFLFAVDVRRARMSRIRPLPVRLQSGTVHAGAIPPAPAPDPVAPTAPVPDMPPVAPGTTPAIGRLDRWKRKLLDLSLRNRLLNFHESKATVPLLFPDLPSLENALAEGQQLEFHPRPQDWQNSDRDTNVHLRRTGEDAEKALLMDEFGHRRLRCDLESTELTRRLTEIYRSARSSLEENGANTLYLALGMLIWYETKSSTQPRQAPILLIPIEIQRRSAQSGFSVRRRDEESMVNVTLLELLRHDFGLQIDGVDPLPEDESGIDVRQVLDRFRQAVKQLDRWDVTETAQVGLFSFTKFLMWRDLERRTDDLKRNKLVSSLINFPTQPFPAASGFPAPERLDDDYRLDETFTPVSADSSQLAAVYAAGESKSFVLHGPPGTGKSQTITNIIAQALAQGKRVLFVAEKMAALNVVERRLEGVGLGPFCLELHSNKSKKADVLAQLETALKIGQLQAPAEWRTQAERLALTRRDLNLYVRTLHVQRRTGESFYTGLSRLISMGSGPRVPLDPQLLSTVTESELATLRDKVRTLAAAGRAVGNPAVHPWRAVRTQDWTPQLRDSVDSAIARLGGTLQGCAQAAAAAARFLRLPEGDWSWIELNALKGLAELLLTRTPVAAALVDASDWEDAQAQLERWIAHGCERDRLRQLLYAHVSDRILQLDLDDLAAKRAVAAQQWFLPRWLTERKVLKALQAVARPGHKVLAADLDRTIELARSLRTEEHLMAAADDQARALLGRLWRDGEADWADVAAARDWAGSVRRFASQLAGEDAVRARDLRHGWAAIVTEQAEMLRDGGTYAVRLRGVAEAVQAMAAGRDALVSLLTLDEPAAWGEPNQPGYIDRMTEALAGWKTQTGQLRLWCAWRKERDEAVALKLDPLVAAAEQGELTPDQLEETFERSFYAGWVDQVTGQQEELRRFSRQSLEERIARFKALDDRFSQLTRQEIQARIAARIPQVGGEANQHSEVGILRRELQKRTRHMALRALFQQIPHLLTRLKPCLLMSPISVAQYLDPSFPPFDLIVFDEASQVPTWDAVGAIARGTETIIVGDPEQLPPTSFFTKGDEPEDEEVVVEDLESILDDSLALTMPELHLRWHYRSRHESLIAFSNYHYYGNGLLSFPSPAADSVVRLRRVGGAYDRSKTRTNRVEADAVVAEVVGRLRNPQTAGLSIGIVTFSMAQQRLVEDLLDEARRRHPEVEPHFGSDLPEPVFVKNLENVQGDERDVILFSVCYGPDSQGKVSVNFGPLNRDGGQRRLNVAITRARQEVVVFTSLSPEQIDLSRTTKVGVHHLRAFLEYAERGTQALKEQVRFAGGGEQEAPFEEHLAEVLTARGYRVRRRVGCSEYRIDLAIEDPENPGQYLLGIECDGASYYGAKTARDRDKLREEVLRGLGWRLHRVWAPEWWQDQEGEMQRLQAAVEGARTEPMAGAGPIEAPAEVGPVLASVEQPAAPVLPVYQVSQAQPPASATELDFYGSLVEPHLLRLIHAVVEAEGPISLNLLCKRVAPFWGINRVTARVQGRVAGLIRAAKVRMTEAGEATFLWPARFEPEAYAEFRVPGGEESARRDADDLPPEEIANAALHVLQRQISLPVEDLVREIARLFGYQRIGQNVDWCLRAGVAVLLERGGAEDQGGVVVVRAGV
jgi:very-short-patch-repair endonuclease